MVLTFQVRLPMLSPTISSDHPGVPNTILIQEEDPLALRYKQKSIAEQNSGKSKNLMSRRVQITVQLMLKYSFALSGLDLENSDEPGIQRIARGYLHH
jgi:hypothetical protein